MLIKTMATDFIIRSGQTSTILNTLKDKGIENLSYPERKSFPILAKEMLSVTPLQPVSGSLFGKTVRFDIPRSTMLRNMILSTSFTTDSGAVMGTTDVQAEQASLLGANIVETIELRTRSRTIFTLSQSSLRAEMASGEIGKQLAMVRRAKAHNGTTGVLLAGAGLATTGANYTATTLTTFRAYFNEEIESNIDTGFVEQLQLVVRYNSQDYAGTTRDLISASPVLYLPFYQPEMTYYNALRSKQFGRATPLQQLIYDTIAEVGVATGLTQNVVDIKINNPAFITVADILDNQAGGLAGRFPIDSFTATFTSRRLYDSLPKLVGSFEQDWHGSPSVDINNSTRAVSLSSASPLVLYWGLDPDNRVMNTGAVAFAQIDNPSITLNHGSLVTASIYNIILTHYFWCLLSTDANTGSMIVSSST